MPRLTKTLALLIVLWLAPCASAQFIFIDSVPNFGQAGQVTGRVIGVNPATHNVAGYLNIEGNGWWTKPTFGMPTVPLNPDGTFAINIGLSGLDEFASTYAISVVPTGHTPPQMGGLMGGSSSLDLGPSSIVSAHEKRYAENLNFVGLDWGVKDVPDSVGPGGNYFSSDSQDVWVDGDGLHLTIQNHGGQWYSTEVVLDEVLGYGTYMFQTSSRQDILDANATFGAFTWDNFGDDASKPDWPFREIDFEDSRWGNPASPTNSQAVVQPYFTSGAVEAFTLPNLSADADLTRFFVWSPGKVEFFTLLGHHQPDNFPESAIIDHSIIQDNPGTGLKVPEPGRENFRFNLWLNDNSGPLSGQPQEVVINDFQFVPYIPGDFDFNGKVNGRDFLKWQQNPSIGSLTDWENNYSTTANLSAAATTVPEPACLGLALATTLVLVCRRQLHE